MLCVKRAEKESDSRILFLVAAALTLAFCAEVEAAGRWYFQGGVSYSSTSDEIGSNAAIIYTQQFGDDGIPFTGDPNERTTCALNRGYLYPEQDPFCDPRPDDLLARAPSIEDTFGLSVAAGFLVTPRFAIQLDAGWVEADAADLRDTADRWDTYLSPPTPGVDGLPAIAS